MGVPRSAEAWAQLPEHWRRAFRHAWAAYLAGTIPVGAVVVDPQGAIAAEGRNRIFDPSVPPAGQIAGSWLAHAELNALAQIGADRSKQDDGWAVYTTLEPCPLCVGAITLAFRGRITVGYAGRDPQSGGLRALTATEIGRRREWRVEELGGPFGIFGELLPAAYGVERRPTSLSASFYRDPPWGPVIDAASATLASSRDRGESVEAVLDRLWPLLERASADGAMTPPPAAS